MNQSVSYSQLRSSLKSYLDKVCSEHLPLLVERKNGEDVVIVSKQDYASMEETSYLLSSPKNTKRLLKALNREPSDRIPFDSIEDLQNEIGI
ncbi:type II toxin-antitoxin system prevent-host-death family antitoxin [Nitrospira defluvii]|nr:type II toxin-antitoxin system prevent-host-death family antitoxin [Nitrospira defluvii]